MQTNIGVEKGIGRPLDLESKDILFRLRRLEDMVNEVFIVVERLNCEISEVKRTIGLDVKKE